MNMDTNMMTISRYITETQRSSGGSGEFTQLMNALVSAIKAISSAVRVAGLNNLMGLAGTGNATGDDQVSLKLFSEDPRYARNGHFLKIFVKKVDYEL